MSSKKRQHFVPKFLLRRFAATEGRWQGHVFRLDVAAGRVRPAVPKTEAARNRYYDLPEEIVGTFQPEEVLAVIESNAAAAIARLERDEQPRPGDIAWLAFFTVLQTTRTPADRAERRYLDGIMETQFQQVRFSATKQATAFLQQQDPSLSEAEAEARRRELVDDLQSGRLRIESTADREVAGMFLALGDTLSN